MKCSTQCTTPSAIPTPKLEEHLGININIYLVGIARAT
jgi:hypothetical protein